MIIGSGGQGGVLIGTPRNGPLRRSSAMAPLDMPMGRAMQASRRARTVARGARTEATAARSAGRFLRGKKGLAVGGGALAFSMYEMGKRRSTGRNGLAPSSTGGMGY